MILIARPDKPLARTPKGTIMRKLSLEIYSGDIEILYVFYHIRASKLLSVTFRYEELVLESSSRNHVEPPPSWDVTSLKGWLIGQLSQMFAGKSLSISTDLFEQGCDRYECKTMVAYDAEKFV